MKKRCSRGKSCGGACIGNSKFCRLEVPTAMRNALDKASEQVGVVELYKAVAAGGKRGAAAEFERIKKNFRNELGRNIRAGEDGKELKRRLIEAGLLPGKQSEKPLGDLFLKALQPKTPREAPDALYGAWPTDQLIKFRKGFDEGDQRFRSTRERIDKELARRANEPAEEPLLVSPPRQLDRSPGARTQTVLPPKRTAATEDVMDDISRILKGESPQVISMVGATTKATGNVIYAREDARDHDQTMLRNGISRELGDKSYRWEDSYGSGSTKLGEGAFGTVLREPNRGNAVKRGEVGALEADLIHRIGNVDLGPKLLAAQIDGDSPYNKKTKIGRIAMTVVPGSPIGSKEPDKEINGVKVADAYWIARADLHRMGIAHNDMHIDNVLIDRKGVARFVDMGLAQGSPKAALAEAMGAFMTPRGATATRGSEAEGGGDWQVIRWNGSGGRLLKSYEYRLKRGAAPGEIEAARKELEKRAPVLARIVDNKAAVQYAMKKDGFSLDDIATVIDHGIRSPMETYNQGVWARMSNEQAEQYISILYEGVV